MITSLVRPDWTNPATHPHPDQSFCLVAEVCESVAVALAAAQWISHRQPKCVGFTVLTVVSLYIFLKEKKNLTLDLSGLYRVPKTNCENQRNSLYLMSNLIYVGKM